MYGGYRQDHGKERPHVMCLGLMETGTCCVVVERAERHAETGGQTESTITDGRGLEQGSRRYLNHGVVLLNQRYESDSQNVNNDIRAVDNCP